MGNNPTLEADFAAVADFERLVAQSQFYRLFPDQDMEQPDGSVIVLRLRNGAIRLPAGSMQGVHVPFHQRNVPQRPPPRSLVWVGKNDVLAEGTQSREHIIFVECDVVVRPTCKFSPDK